MAAIVVDESLMRAELLADLVFNATAYRVVNGGADTSMAHRSIWAAEAAIGWRSGTDAQRPGTWSALFDMDEPALRAWMATQTRTTCVGLAGTPGVGAAKVAVR